MENNHLNGFEVKGFKKFTDLSIDDLGQFNLIVGDNNSGKTTLLEALLVDKESVKFHEYLSDILIHIKKFSRLTENFFNYYFSDTQENFPLKIYFKLIYNDETFQTIKYTKLDPQKIYQHFLQNHYPLENDHGSLVESLNISSDKSFNFKTPFIPFGPLYSHELTKIYGDNIQLYVDKKERLIESLSHIIRNIKNIEVSTTYSWEPILLISEKSKNKLAPLATYGDGTLKLFRILLSLFSTKDYNRLMIDEVDTGVHFSRLKDFLKSLMLVSKEQKKQIFATTHSKECVQYFKDALSETDLKNDGRIIRLADTKSGTKAYTMKFEEFETALQADSEIR